MKQEISVEKMPFRVDFLVIRRSNIDFPDKAKQELHALTERLNTYTAIEFKSPVDSLESGDWAKFVRNFHHYLATESPSVPREELTMILLVPSLNRAFEQEIGYYGHRLVAEEPGVWKIEGGLFTAYLITTENEEGRDEPILTCFCPSFLQRRPELISELKEHHLEVLAFVMQQIQQLRQNPEDFESKHMIRQMDETDEDLRKNILSLFAPEERLEGLTPRDVVANFEPKQLLDEMTPEQRLEGMSPDEIVQALQKQLERIAPEKLKKIEPSQNTPEQPNKD